MGKSHSILRKCIIFYTLFLLSLKIYGDSGVLWSEYEQKFEHFTARLYSTKTINPGDPVAVKLIIIPADKKTKKLFSQKTDATVVYYSNETPDKKLRTSKLYLNDKIPAASKSKCLTGFLPTSTYLAVANYRAEIIFDAFGYNDNRISFSFNVEPKDFISETIQLNSRNTAIRTDDSEERMKQIEKLNSILTEKNPEGIWETGSFNYPSNATRRTSFFGDRRIFAYSNGEKATSLHYGIDWGAPEGTAINSCGRGKIVMAEFRITTGWSICIEHLPGLYSLYYHMSRIDVKPDQIVEKGQQLGLSGSTGLATGPHIHWEIRLNSEAVNPDWFINHSF